MEHIEKTREGRIVCVARPIANIFGEMCGHRTIRSQQAKEIHDQPWRFLTVTVQAETAQRGWEENEVRFLTEAHSVVSRTQRRTHTRQARIRAFKQTDGLEKVESVCVDGKPVQDGHSVLHIPLPGAQRMISPRVALVITVSVNEFSETYCVKKRASTAPKRNALAPSKPVSSISRLISRPRPNTIGPRDGKRRVTGCVSMERRPSTCLAAATSPAGA